MPSTGTRAQFIEDIAQYVIKYGPQYGILVNSPVIAQAVIESKYGESGLAKYCNYFGLKCGSSWNGPSVNMKTKEEYTPGVYTDIKDNFRVYSNMEEGVKGYYDFINRSRYANLKGVTDPMIYVVNIKNDGYATSSTYVNTIMNCIANENLTRFDNQSGGSVTPTPAPVVTQYSPDVVLDIAQKCLGASEANGKYKTIIDIYNTQNPLPRGYKVKYTDSWCATFVSACAIVAGYTKIIPPECSCEYMIKNFQKIGCWQEDESVTPSKGWVIFYDWQDNGIGDNVGHSDHVGYVLSVSGGTIQVIEGNYHDAVGIRTIAVNGKCIRGYGVPKYTTGSVSTPVVTPTTPSTPVTPSVPAQSGTITVSKTEKYKAKVNAHKLNVRSWAGTNYSQVSFSPLVEGTVVGVCDSVKDSSGTEWNYICYNNKYGFCSSKYLTPINNTNTQQQNNTNPYVGTFVVNVKTTLNLRSTPDTSTSSNIIAKLPNGTKVTAQGKYIILDNETWLEVTYNNVVGYCNAKYLIKVG